MRTRCGSLQYKGPFGPLVSQEPEAPPQSTSRDEGGVPLSNIDVIVMNMDDAIWNATVFSKNRRRLLDGDIAAAFFDAVLRQVC